MDPDTKIITLTQNYIRKSGETVAYDSCNCCGAELKYERGSSDTKCSCVEI